MKNASLTALAASLATVLVTATAGAQTSEKLDVNATAKGLTNRDLGPPVIVDDFQWSNRLGDLLPMKGAGDTSAPGPVTEPVDRTDGSEASSTGKASWQIAEGDHQMKEFGQPEIIIDDFSTASRAAERTARDLRAAVDGMAQILPRRRPSQQDFQSMYDAVAPVGLERYVREMESVPVLELRDLGETWTKVVDTLLHRTFQELQDKRSAGKLDGLDFARIEELLNDRADAAKVAGVQSKSLDPLNDLVADVRGTGLSQVAMNTLQRELVEDQLRGAMSYVYEAAERGFIPAGWRMRLAELFGYRSGIGR